MANAIAKLIEAIQDPLDRLAATYKKLESTLDEKKEERQRLQTLAVTKVDAIRILHHDVDRNAAEFSGNLRAQFANTIWRKPFIEDAWNQQPDFPRFALIRHRAGDARLTSPQILTGLLADLLKERCAEAIEKMDWPETGPPLAERRKRIVKLEKEIAELEEELSNLRAAADRRGVILR